MRVVVVGAGVLGCSVAYRLALAGHAVTVLEASRVGSGTSSCSYAWLNSSDKSPRSYHDLNVAGIRAHGALRDAFPDAPWLHGGGGLEVAEGADGGAALDAKARRLRGWDYAADLLTPREVAALEPDLDLSAFHEPTVLFAPGEGWLDPVLFAGAMVRAATDRGAVLRTHTPVADLLVEAGVVRGVLTGAGERVEADAVVNCAGRWCNDASRDAGLHIPLAPRLGLLVITPPAPVALQRILRTPLVDARPDGAGRLLLHDNAADAGLQPGAVPSPAMPEAGAMVAAATRLFPAIAGIAAEAARIVTRPVPGDGYSAVGWVPGIEGYYLAVTHSAVTLSAHLGGVIAAEVAGEPGDDALLPFRPARFFGGNAGPLGAAEALTHAG